MAKSLKNYLLALTLTGVAQNSQASLNIFNFAPNLTSLQNNNILASMQNKLFSPASGDVDDIDMEEGSRKFGNWVKAFGSFYKPTKEQEALPINYSYKNYGATLAIETSPNDSSLIGLAYTYTNGKTDVTVKNPNLPEPLKASSDIQTHGGSIFGGLRLYKNFIRTEFVASMHFVNADVKDPIFGQQVLKLEQGKEKVKARIMDYKIKLICDTLPFSQISVHPYVGFGYSGMNSEDLKQLNNDKDKIYHSYKAHLGISAVGYYDVGEFKFYPSVYTEYDIILNPGKEEDSTELEKNFEFGNNLSAGFSLTLAKDIYSTEIGYEFNKNKKLIGNSGFIKFKLSF